MSFFFSQNTSNSVHPTMNNTFLHLKNCDRALSVSLRMCALAYGFYRCVHGAMKRAKTDLYASGSKTL